MVRETNFSMTAFLHPESAMFWIIISVRAKVSYTFNGTLRQDQYERDISITKRFFQRCNSGSLMAISFTCLMELHELTQKKHSSSKTSAALWKKIVFEPNTQRELMKKPIDICQHIVHTMCTSVIERMPRRVNTFIIKSKGITAHTTTHQSTVHPAIGFIPKTLKRLDNKNFFTANLLLKITLKFRNIQYLYYSTTILVYETSDKQRNPKGKSISHCSTLEVGEKEEPRLIESKDWETWSQKQT